MRHVVLALAATLSAVILAAGGLAVLVLTTGEPRPLTIAATEWAISSAVGAPVRIGGSSGSPLFGLELTDVEIAPETSERFEIERIRIEIDSISPFERDFGVRRLSVAGLRIDGRRELNGRWRWAAGEIDLDAQRPEPVEPAEPDVRVRVRELTLEDARLHLVWVREGEPDRTLEARLDATVRRAEWPLEARLDRLPASELRLSEIRASTGAIAVDRGAIEIRLVQGQLELTASDLAGPWGAVPSARATFEVEGTTEAPALGGAGGELHFAGLDPAPLAGFDLAASNLAGRAEFAWDGSRLALEATLDRSIAAGIAIERGAARGTLWREGDGLRFELESASVQSAIGTLEASASGDHEGVREGVIHALVTDLGDWPPAARPAWLEAGRASLDGRWHGAWASPSGTFDLRLDEVRVADVGVRTARMRAELIDLGRLRVHALDVTLAEGPAARIVATDPFTIAWPGDAIAIDDARLDLTARSDDAAAELVAAGRIGVHGTVSADAFDRLRVTAQGLDLIALPLDPAGRFAPGGRLDGSLTVDGPRRAPLLTGHIDWSSPRLGEISAERVRLELEPLPDARRQQASLALAARGVPALEARGSFSTRDLFDAPARLLDDDSLEVDVTLHEVDAAAFAALVAMPEPAPSGRLTGQARLRGPLRLPLIDGRLSGRAIVWRQLPASDLELRVDAADPTGRAVLDLALQQAEHAPLSLHFETADRMRLAAPRVLAREPGSTLSLRLDRLDLAWLDAFTESLGFTTQGRADGEVRFESGEVPTADGELQVDGLALSGPGLPFDVGPIPARFEFAEHVARSTELRLSSRRGDAGLRGQISWHDPAEPMLQLRARATDFAIDVPGIIYGRVDGDAVVEGPVMALDARGEFALHHTRIDLPDPQDPILAEIRIRQTPSRTGTSLTEERREGVYDAAEGELLLTIGDSVWLRGLGTEFMLRGKLAARKERHAPAALYGTVEVAAGRISFQGRWLRITSGSAIFDGAADPDPFIDATAMHRVDQVTIYVRLRGQSSDLELELDSEPPLPVEDQLAYLLFDRPAAEISASEQQGISTAAMAASEMLLGRFGNELGREVGLDRVRLGVDDDESPYLEVEKLVHERVAMRYGRSFGGLGGDRFVIEWRLFRQIFLSGEQMTSGESGVDVFWRRDY